MDEQQTQEIVGRLTLRRAEARAALERTDLRPAQRAEMEELIEKCTNALFDVRHPADRPAEHPDFGPIDQPPTMPRHL
jgi:hypothetical protein